MTSARAIDARICMPPESSRGKCRAKSREADERERLRRRRDRRCRARRARDRAAAARWRRRAPTASASATGTRTPSWRPATAGRARRPAPPRDRARARARAVRRSGCSSVDLPQPDGPSSVRNSPRRTSRSTGASACVPFGVALLDAAQRRRPRAASSSAVRSGQDFDVLHDVERPRASRNRRPALRESGAAQEVDRALPARVGHREQAAASRVAAGRRSRTPSSSRGRRRGARRSSRDSPS